MIKIPFIGPPRNLTTTQRNALATTDRPTGMIIWNTTTSQLEVNTGTGASPTWVAVNASTWDATYVPRATYLASFSTFSTTYVSTGLTITIPATGSYVIEFGASQVFPGAQGQQSFLSTNLSGGPSDTLSTNNGNVSGGGTGFVKEFTGLTAAQVITLSARGTNGGFSNGFNNLYLKYSRFA